MTMHTQNEMQRLSQLPPAMPDAARRERTRARCHAALAKRNAQSAPAGTSAGPAQWLELTLLGAFCLVYLSAVIRGALQ